MNYYNYFTEIEEHFVRRRGKHLYVSPLDWSLIATWRDSGVPLHVALRGIDIAMDGFFARTRKIQTKVNTLLFCHDAVMTEYARHLESHQGEAESGAAAPPSKAVAEEPDAAVPSKAAILRYLAVRMGEIKALREKQSGQEDELFQTVERVVRRLEEITADLEGESEVELEAVERDLGMLDELLTDALCRAAGDDQLAEWEKEAKKDLKVYRKRLPKETYGRILSNYIRSRVRSKFGVGELSLFQL
jgi:hypothetical protein